jgi:hypothetical protein
MRSVEKPDRSQRGANNVDPEGTVLIFNSRQLLLSFSQTACVLSLRSFARAVTALIEICGFRDTHGFSPHIGTEGARRVHRIRTIEVIPRKTLEMRHAGTSLSKFS